jgi:biopolymer transport protein ExbD
MNRIVCCCVGALMALAVAAQTPELRKGVSVQMPVTTNAAAMPDADLADSVIVAVTRRGTTYLEVATVTPAELSAKVKGALAGHAGKRVYLKGDSGAAYSSVAAVLDALRSAGVEAPILLTSQRDSTNARYVPPMGFEVLLTPPAPGVGVSVNVRSGSEVASDAWLKQQAQRARPVVLHADGATLFGDVVHAADVYGGLGAKVYLAGMAK